MKSASEQPPILITPGEPAGIGPDVLIKLAATTDCSSLLVIADPALISDRAKALNLDLKIQECNDIQNRPKNSLNIYPVKLKTACKAGQPDLRNASYVIECLSLALHLTLDNKATALVTGPVQKSVINDAGIQFTGHTEWLAHETGSAQVVMMLSTDSMRVALVTTHMPLSEVAPSLSEELIISVASVLERELREKFGLAAPRILVCGLNPHAGESGHLGSEDENIIRPAIAKLRAMSVEVTGPLPADTAFTPKYLQEADVILAMYHDQGLPVLKYSGFGNAANITLGLPLIRTSVDHGTALDLAGSGNVDTGSLSYALSAAKEMITQSKAHPLQDS